MSIIQNPYDIFSLKRQDFLKTALEVFRFQAMHNHIYKQYLAQLRCDINAVRDLKDIPFLPIQFFKSHRVASFTEKEALLFESSSTTSQIPAKHYIKDKEMYKQAIFGGFEQAFGSAEGYCILALLPHYLERPNSSLVYMVQCLMDASGHVHNGFYLNNITQLKSVIIELEKIKQPTLLFGVTFALLDLADDFKLDLKYVQLIETGGMKGRKEEMSRKQVHQYLQDSFGSKLVYSEYGMAELLSQSYYTAAQKFIAPPWKKVLIRDVYDPFCLKEIGRGALNVIDLANIYSCSFVATDDIGELFEDGTFLVNGRLDQSEIRGCNLLLTD